MATTRLGTLALSAKPYGATGNDVFDPKAPSGITDETTSTGIKGPRKKSGIGPK